jgi:pSer/pThr/pTyr-binding forkhead associated (FHA) protein
MAAVVLYMEDDSIKVQRLESETTSIGRHPESDVVLTCASSSGRHAAIKQVGSDFFVQDLGSSNGTRVNGAEVEEAKLKDGDRIGFGDVQAVFYAGEPPSQDQIKTKAPVSEPVKKVVALPVPEKQIIEPPSPPKAVARAPLSPVRRAYSRSTPSEYPDTTGSGCMTAVIVIGLFICAFIVGLSLRHMKEMNGNFITDFVQKITDKVPTIKVERKEDAGK